MVRGEEGGGRREKGVVLVRANGAGDEVPE